MMIIACQDGRVVDVAHATLTGARLSGVSLHAAVLESQCMCGADFSLTDLRSAVFSLACADGSQFIKANLSNLSGERCSFRGANFFGARLNGAFLVGADLTGASLAEAELFGTRFAGALLSGADLFHCDLSEADLQLALYDEATRWPPNFNPIEAGAVRVGDQHALFYRTGPSQSLFGDVLGDA